MEDKVRALLTEGNAYIYVNKRLVEEIKNTMRHPTLKVCPSGKSAFGGVGFGRALVFWMLGETTPP